MQWIDMHCDTLMVGLEEGQQLFSNEAHLDFSRMEEGHYLAQFFAVFMQQENNITCKGKIIDDEHYIQILRDFLLSEVDEHPDLIQMAYGYDDLIENKKNEKMSAFLTLEDGRPIQNKMKNIEKLYNLGFRAIGLTWNFENDLGYPNNLFPDMEISAEMATIAAEKKSMFMHHGLKDFGKEAVEYMMELGILVDVSHLSDGGFWDVAAISRKKQRPFIASHSNAREKCAHARNLTDEMIIHLSDCGGVAGMNFAPVFLREKTDDMIISDVIKHMQHMKNIGGIEVIGMGTDFDGITGNLEISDASNMPKLLHVMEKVFTASEIDKITHENVMRVLKDSMVS